MHFNFVKACVLLVSTVSLASAASFSFSGAFGADNSVQLFGVTLQTDSTVVFRTYSYAGGITQSGTVVPRGGFDPFLSVFDSAGHLIYQNDDGLLNVSPDPVTGQYWDSYIRATLPAGNYTVALTQYDNYAPGPNLSDGFIEGPKTNFTAAYGCSNQSFCDKSGANRNALWYADVTGVTSAAEVSNVPEPSVPALLAAGLTCLGVLRRRRYL